MSAKQFADRKAGKRPKSSAVVPLEHAEQSAFFKWWREYSAWMKINTKLCFAVPNASKLSERARIYMWNEGLTAGVLDVFLAVPRGGYHGLFIEFKRKGRKPTEEQIEFGKAADGQGYFTGVCYSANEGVLLAEKYLSGSILRP